MHKWYDKITNADVKRRGKDDWKIITIVRDPVAINVSSYWQWAARHIVENGSVKYPEAVCFYFDTQDHYSPIHHLAAEVEAFWGLNIYGPNWANPYTIIDDRCLVLKYEFIEAWPEAIEKFLGIPKAPFPHLGASKQFADLKFTNAYLRSLYRSKHAEHFYTEAEVNCFVEKWGGDPYQRIDGAKHVKILSDNRPQTGAGRGVGLQPIRIIHDQTELDEFTIEGRVTIEGPHGKEASRDDL
jgi:hypothetical protein